MISWSQLWFYRAVVKHLKLPACVLSLCICPVTFDPDLFSSFTPKCCTEMQQLCAFVLLFLLSGCDVDVKVQVWWGFMFFLINKSYIKNKQTHTASSCCRYSLQHKMWIYPYWKNSPQQVQYILVCLVIFPELFHKQNYFFQDLVFSRNKKIDANLLQESTSKLSETEFIPSAVHVIFLTNYFKHNIEIDITIRI